MKAEEKESPKSKQHLNIPEGAMVIIPLRNRVLFPSMIMPVMVAPPGEAPRGRRDCSPTTAYWICHPTGSEYRRSTAQRPLRVGTAADVLRMYTLPDGQRQILVQGRRRFEIGEFLETDPLLIARVTMVEEKTPQTKEFEARILHLRQEAARALSLFPEPMNELRSMIERIDDPLSVIDVIASTLDLPSAEKQEILAILDPETRAQRVSEKLARQIELLELSKKIGDETNESMDKSQRQYFLREQLKAIQKELGEEDGKG